MKPSRLSPQLRLSAATALLPALQFVLVTLVMIPFTAILGLVFGSDRHVDWRVSITVGGILGLIWFVAIFLSTLADLRKEDRIEVTGSSSFPAQSFVSGLYGLTTVVCMWAILGLHRDHEPLWLQLLPLGFIAIAFYGWPRTIRCNETNLTQRAMFGWKKRIPYVSVEAISVGSDGTTTVLGAGTTIEHTSHHIDAATFRETVSRRSGRPIW
jgi:hypothetical protein